MLDGQPVGADVVAVDDQAGVGGVVGPADPGTVIGTPRPDVVEDRVAVVDDQSRGRLARLGTADPEEHVLHERRVVRVGKCPTAGVTARPDAPCELPSCSSTGEFCGPASKIMPGELDPRHVSGPHRHVPVLRDERGEAKSQHDRVRAPDDDRPRQVIDARRQDEVAPASELGVDLRHRRARVRDEEPRDRNRLRRPANPRRRTARPNCAAPPGTNTCIATVVVGVEVRLLLRNRARGDVRVLPAGDTEVSRRRAVVAHEHLFQT